MELSVQPDETALDLLRRANRKPLRTGLAFLDEVFLRVFFFKSHRMQCLRSVLLWFLEARTVVMFGNDASAAGSC